MAVNKLPVNYKREDMNIVIVGHVDHGKSTIVGRLLADTNSLPLGKLEQVKETCRRNAKPFEFAFLLDALKDEQSQGITIDAARCFFKTSRRNYIIIDAPGHIEFLKNMVTGASRAEAALLVVDAEEGVQENSRRHGYMLSMLGIKQVSLLVNKMDLVGYKEEASRRIVTEYTEFLNRIGINPSYIVPVCGMQGENIAAPSDSMPWYQGPTVLEVLDSFEAEPLPGDKPFRMPVQAVYKFTRDGDKRRIVAGTVEAGRLNVGDKVVFYPSGKCSAIKTIEVFNHKPLNTVGAGSATGFTLTEQIYVTRGDLAVIAGQPAPQVSSRFRANIFWLGKAPMTRGKAYLLKLGTARVVARLEEIIRVIDASNLANEKKEQISRHDVAECILRLDRAIAFDLAEQIAHTSRFVLVDDYEIAGGGIVQEALEDKQSWVREKVYQRNVKWEQGIVTAEDRAEKYNQRAILILITGNQSEARKAIAKALEQRLFQDGKMVYFLGIGSVLYGIDADINRTDYSREEHLRRLAELSHIMLDAGMILIVTARELSHEDLELIKTTVNPEKIQTVWVGENITTNISYDFHIPVCEVTADAVEKIKQKLQDRGIIFKP